MEKTGCKIICGAPTTLAVKGLMMMMMMMMMMAMAELPMPHRSCQMISVMMILAAKVVKKKDIS